MAVSGLFYLCLDWSCPQATYHLSSSFSVWDTKERCWVCVCVWGMNKREVKSEGAHGMAVEMAEWVSDSLSHTRMKMRDNNLWEGFDCQKKGVIQISGSLVFQVSVHHGVPFHSQCFLSLQETGTLGLAVSLSGLWSGSKYTVMTICRPSLLFLVYIFPLTRSATGFVDESPATRVVSFLQLFVFRERTGSEGGSSTSEKNDTSDGIASAALEKIILLRFESYKNKALFLCNKACGSCIPLHIITEGQARQRSGYFSGSLIVLSPWFLEIDESGSSFISGHFKRHWTFVSVPCTSKSWVTFEGDYKEDEQRCFMQPSFSAVACFNSKKTLCTWILSFCRWEDSVALSASSFLLNIWSYFY